MNAILAGPSPVDSGLALATATVWELRLPRTLLALCVGAALGAAGCLFQLVFRNPLASPDVLGVSSGAALAAALAILLGASLFGVQVAALLGGLTLVSLVWALARQRRDSSTHLLLAGMALASLASAGVVAMKLVADPQNQLPSLTYWMMGSLASARLSLGLVLLAVLLLSMLIFSRDAARWQALSFPEAEMRGLGFNTKRSRLWALGVGTLLTALSVAAAGLIGWIGLIVPHAARQLVGERWRPWFWLSTLLGALLLLAVDLLSRVAFSTEWPPGVLLALVGVPVFLSLLRRAP